MVRSALQAMWRVVSPLKGCRKWIRSGVPFEDDGETGDFLLGVPDSPGIEGSGGSMLATAAAVEKGGV